VPTVADEELTKHRQERLRAFGEHHVFGGNRAEAGRAIGLKNGAYLWQMIEGLRPITEKTIAKVEAARGGVFKGWFDRPEAPQTPEAALIDSIDAVAVSSLTPSASRPHSPP